MRGGKKIILEYEAEKAAGVTSSQSNEVTTSRKLMELKGRNGLAEHNDRNKQEPVKLLFLPYGLWASAAGASKDVLAVNKKTNLFV